MRGDREGRVPDLQASPPSTPVSRRFCPFSRFSHLRKRGGPKSVEDRDQGFGDQGLCSGVRVLLGRKENLQQAARMGIWKRLGQEAIGRALGGARVGTEEGSHRCSTEAARMCRKGRRRPGRAPPSPRHSHCRPPRPQLGPGLPPQALPPVAIATPFVPASRALPARRHQAAGAGPGTGVIPQDAQKGGIGTPPARPPNTILRPGLVELRSPSVLSGPAHNRRVFSLDPFLACSGPMRTCRAGPSANRDAEGLEGAGPSLLFSLKRSPWLLEEAKVGEDTSIFAQTSLIFFWIFEKSPLQDESPTLKPQIHLDIH